MVSTEIKTSLAGFIRPKQKATDSGDYQRNARRIITDWIDWLGDHDPPVEIFDQLGVARMRRYARELNTALTGAAYWNETTRFSDWLSINDSLSETENVALRDSTREQRGRSPPHIHAFVTDLFAYRSPESEQYLHTPSQE